MAAHEIRLQVEKIVRGNAHIGEFSEPGVDSVDDITALDNGFDNAPRRHDSRIHRVGDFDSLFVNGHRGDVRQGQRPPT